ncbi:hypothetical protein DSCO28_09980 [Desulfosarcina ovata subsp. sediminis]|uniref:YhcG N-terminal domain-containing protein n=1 Tax=Desulfosarcina ovata subsp. sediminis TaxID=885957 RepID=A0A5K7ZEF3_9BACT|nr:hypothetical protein [Desulfosarcina ovata]BBO80432.1 hypothetical protein DSCO28_09980 [Desulfosarcina ovata subsp. sediminis]
MDSEKLVGAIRYVHTELAAQASRAVNVSLTLRNWMIGCYITEYEQNGANCGAIASFTRPTRRFGRQCLPNCTNGCLVISIA